MNNNRAWASIQIKKNPSYFEKLVDAQKPDYLWIGCSDSRVPSNEISGLELGELFVHRNIANQVPPSDVNIHAVLQYAVEVLKVKDIMVVGHYGCGGIKAAFRKHDHGPLEAWLSHIRDLRALNKNKLTGSHEENQNLLVQLNVEHQVINVARFPIVQKAWKMGEELRIHGLVYKLEDGILHDLGLTIGAIKQLPEELRLIE